MLQSNQKMMQTERIEDCFLIAQVLHVLFKEAEYELEYPADNHKNKPYETNQYESSKYDYQNSAYKEKHVLLLYKFCLLPFQRFDFLCSFLFILFVRLCLFPIYTTREYAVCLVSQYFISLFY